MGYNRHRFPDNITFAPRLCRDCPQYDLFKVIAESTPGADPTLNEADFSIVALRTCRTGHNNDPERACDFMLDPASALAQHLASQTGKNRV